MKTQHTQGEWFKGKSLRPENIYARRNDDEVVMICRIEHPSYYSKEYEEAKSQKEANAKLIAAAPDLLKALLDLKESYVALAVRHGYHDNVDDWLIKLGTESAIKKATE